MSFKTHTIFFVLALSTIIGCVKSQPNKTSGAGESSKDAKRKSEHEQSCENVTTVDTKVQLGTLLRRISEHKPFEEWIRNKIKTMLNESVFGGMLRADTPYGDNLSVAQLNQYRKDRPMLTAETLVDLKPFALKLENQWKEFLEMLPDDEELRTVPLNLLCVIQTPDGDKSEFYWNDALHKRPRQLIFDYILKYSAPYNALFFAEGLVFLDEVVEGELKNSSTLAHLKEARDSMDAPKEAHHSKSDPKEVHHSKRARKDGMEDSKGSKKEDSKLNDKNVKK